MRRRDASSLRAGDLISRGGFAIPNQRGSGEEKKAKQEPWARAVTQRRRALYCMRALLIRFSFSWPRPPKCVFADKGDLLPSRGDKALKERIYFQTPIRTRLINRVNVSWHENELCGCRRQCRQPRSACIGAWTSWSESISGIWFRETANKKKHTCGKSDDEKLMPVADWFETSEFTLCARSSVEISH
jgi:hypothetical protein